MKCKYCKDLSWEPAPYRTLKHVIGITEEENEGSQEISSEDIQKGSQAGCQACGLIEYGYGALKQGIPAENLQITLDGLLNVAPATSNAQQGGIEYFTLPGKSTPHTAIGVATDVHEESWNPACFALINPWLKECLNNHPECRTPEMQVPTRVIRFDRVEPRYYLYEPQQGELFTYVALSYSWGTDHQNQLTTTKATIESRRRKIAWEEFPQTFQDALVITEESGFQSLWIDALCIIQDDEDDWQAEAAKMGLIYQNAWLVISAAASRGASTGIFSRRFYDKQQRFHQNSHQSLKLKSADGNGNKTVVHVRRKLNHYNFLNGGSIQGGTVADPLFRRAWAFQERFLAKRIIHFTRWELVWECQERLRCECSFLDNSDVKKAFKYVHTKDHRDEAWTDLVSLYTRRKITYESDRLPALSALAQQVKHGKGKYLAGIWENDLPWSLLWHPISDCHKSSNYSAPSFSWASVEGEISFLVGADYRHRKDVICIAQVIEVECIPKSPDLFGKVTGGSVQLRAPVRHVTLDKVLETRPDYQNAAKTIYCYWTHVDDQIYDRVVLLDTEKALGPTPFPLKALFVLLWQYENEKEDIEEHDNDLRPWNVLMLRAVDEKRAIYERIGVAKCHSYLGHRDEVFNGAEEQTITIV